MEKFYRIYGKLCMLSFPIPAARRIYRNNPVDYGKLWFQMYLYSIVFCIAGLLLLFKSEKLATWLVNIFDKEEVFQGRFLNEDKPAKTNDFIRRYATGDQVQVELEPDDPQWYTVATDQGDSILIEDHNSDYTYSVSKKQVLDYNPVF